MIAGHTEQLGSREKNICGSFMSHKKWTKFQTSRSFLPKIFFKNIIEIFKNIFSISFIFLHVCFVRGFSDNLGLKNLKIGFLRNGYVFLAQVRTKNYGFLI